jgi:hypothetical protein
MTEKDFIGHLVPPGLLNSLLAEELNTKEGLKKVREVTQAFLRSRLKEKDQDLRLFNTEVEKRANVIYVRYNIRHKNKPPERFFIWEVTEQDLLAYDPPVTDLLEESLIDSLMMFRKLEAED